MGKSADEVRQEITQTREQLGTTLEAIEDRVSPGRIVERRKAQVKERTTAVRHRIMGVPEHVRDAAGSAAESASSTAHEIPDRVRDRTEGSPVAAGLIAFGLGLLVAAVLPATEQEKQLVPKVREAAEPLVEQAKEGARDMKDELASVAQDKAGEVKATVSDAASEVKDAASSSASEVAGRAKDAGQAASP